MRVVRVPRDGDYGVAEGGFLEAREHEHEPEPEYPLVLVTWHDAWFDFDQEGPDAERADYLVRTVGFLVSDGPRFVSIAQEILPEGDGFRAVTHIPRSIIESVTGLSEIPADAQAEPAG